MVKRSTLLCAALMGTAVPGASAWASMMAKEGGAEGLAGAPGMAPGAGPAMAPGPGAGPEGAPTPGYADAPAPGATPYFDPYAEPTFMPTYDMYSHATFTPMYFSGAPTPKAASTTGECMDYVWDDKGVMSYGAVPCPTPSFMETPTATQTFMELDEESAKKVELIKEEAAEAAAHIVEDAEVDEELKPTVQILAAATESQSVVTKISAEMTALSPDDACDKLWAALHLPHTSGTCSAHLAEGRRRALLSGAKYHADVILDPKVVDAAAVEKATEAVKSAPGIEATVTVVSPSAELKEMDGVSNAAVEELEAKAAEIVTAMPLPEPVTTPPNVVGAPLTGCYELDSSPPEGYVHAESNLEFNADRSDQAAVIYEVNSEKFTSLTCSEAPTHHFQGSDYCKGTDKCDEVCHTNMPPKCNATASSFGVCAPTVDQICAHMQTSKDSCALASQKVIDATISYNHLDVQNSPCVSSIHKVTADAHEAYRVAYDEWVYAYNNASHACKVGAAIRDYNGMAFVQHHQNMDNIQKVSEMVCNDLDGFDFNAPHRRSLLNSKNNETCQNINQLIAEIKADTDLASRQIQCFASECMATKSLEAFKFQTLVNKFYEYDKTLTDYKSSVESYNEAVEDKYLKKAAAEESFDVFNPLKADMTAKFHKDLEVYMSFASGAAEGNCGLTDCEMTAVCSFEMQYKFSDYVTKSDRGCVRNDKPVVELCYSEGSEESA